MSQLARTDLVEIAAIVADLSDRGRKVAVTALRQLAAKRLR